MTSSKFYFVACMTLAGMLSSCVGNQFIASSGLRSADFRQKVEGEKTALYRICNQNGLEACITNYGARVVSLMYPTATVSWRTSSADSLI